MSEQEKSRPTEVERLPYDAARQRATKTSVLARRQAPSPVPETDNYLTDEERSVLRWMGDPDFAQRVVDARRSLALLDGAVRLHRLARQGGSR